MACVMDDFEWDGNDLDEILDALDELPSPPMEETEPQYSSEEFMVDAKRRKTESCADALNKQSPLGLTLRKSSSFVDLIEMKLSQRMDILPNDLIQSIRIEKQAIKVDKFKTQPISTKWKASNFPAKMLVIGSWKIEAQNEGDVIVKFYYAKRKLLWEILDNGLKKKIEIYWSDISTIRASFADGQPGVLEVELKQQPLFFGEIDPQPRKHTFWQPISDFTQGQASLIRRHYLEFPEGILEKHYERLLSCDDRLLKLNQRSFPIYSSPFFENVINDIQGVHGNKRKFQFPCNQPLNTWFTSHIHQSQRIISAPLQHLRTSEFLDHLPLNGSYSRSHLKATVGVTQVESPSSVMEFPPIMEQEASGASSRSYCLEKNNVFINSMFGMDPIPNTQAQYGDHVIQKLQSAYDIVELPIQHHPSMEQGSTIHANEQDLESFDKQFFWELDGLPAASCIDENRLAVRENSITPAMNIAITVHSHVGMNGGEYNLDGANLFVETKDYNESSSDKEMVGEDEMLFKISRLVSYML